MMPVPGSDEDRAEILLLALRALGRSTGPALIRTHYFILRWLATEPLGTLNISMQSAFVQLVRENAPDAWARIRPYLLPTCWAAKKGYL